MATLTHVGVLFSATLTAALMAGVGFVAGLLYAGIGFFVDLLGPGLNVGTALAFMALVGMPIIFAAGGFLAGAVGAVLFNLVVRWFGGIQIDMNVTPSG